MTLIIYLSLVLLLFVIGQIVLLSSDLELRTVCPRIWANAWLYVLASFIWPVFYLWIRAKWLRKQRSAGSI